MQTSMCLRDWGEEKEKEKERDYYGVGGLLGVSGVNDFHFCLCDLVNFES